jgi:uncharacterized membrane protein YeaQ/YmgE (transglycosylase-associated protein family)
MPKAVLPTTPAGWLVFILVGTVGAVAGFFFLRFLELLGLG